MFKIGVFSKLVRVSPRMLRHYEKCGLLTPDKIDKFSSYRFYSMKQIPLLNKITKLRDMGFSISEIADILPNYDSTQLINEALQKKIKETHAAVLEKQEQLKRLRDMSEQLLKGDDNMVYDVELKALPAVNVISLREVIADYSKEEFLWGKLYQFIADNNIPIKTGEGAYSAYLDDEYKESDVEIEISIPVAELGKNTGNFVYKELELIPLAATIKFSGSYMNYGEAMEKLGIWLEENAYEVIGGVRGMALHDLTNQDSQIEIELQLAVKKQGKY